MQKKEKCVVAGGGPAGVEVAALLAKLKPELKPVLFEKDHELGGRAKTYYINGYWVEHGQHLSVLPSETSPLLQSNPLEPFQPRCARLAGANLTYKDTYPTLAYMHPAFPGEEINLQRISPLNPLFDRELTKKVFPYLNDRLLNEAEGLYQTLRDEMLASEEVREFILSGRDPTMTPKKTIGSWLKERAPSELTAKYVVTMMASNMGIPEEDARNATIYFPAGGMIVGLSLDWHRYSYPVNPNPPKYGGWASETLAYRDVLLGNGGRIYTNTPVRKIVIENKKVKGVVVEHEGKDESIETDLVIVDIPPPEALDTGVLDEKEMDPEWVRGVRLTEKTERDLYSTGYVIACFCLKKPLTKGKAWTCVLDEQGNIVGSIDAQRNPDTAPPGKQVLSFMRLLRFGEKGEKPKPDMKAAQEVVNEYILPHLRLHWPDFDDQVEYCLIHQHPYIWDVVLYANHSDVYTTPIDVPGVEGLYYVGTWTRARWVLTLKCADSAIKCAEIILGRELR